MNPVRNHNGASNAAEIILELNPTAKQRGIISNGVKVRRFNHGGDIGHCTGHHLERESPAMRALFFVDKFSDKTKSVDIAGSTTPFFVQLTCPKASSYPKNYNL